MRIQSEFKDYYDSVQSNKLEEKKDKVYKRTYRELNSDVVLTPTSKEYLNSLLKNSPINFIRSGSHDKHLLAKLTTALLLFCGKVYPLYRLCNYTDYHCSIDTLIKNLKENNDEHSLSLLRGFEEVPTLYSRSNSTEYKKQSSCYEQLSTYTERTKVITPYISLFIELDTPIFIYTEETTIINPCLNNYGFQAILNPYNVYQEISIFLDSIYSIKKKETNPT